MSKESFPGLWDISAAGHITAGDTSQRAAVRELEEELGIAAKEGELEFLFTIKGFYEDVSRPFLDHEFSDVYLMKTTVSIDNVVFQKEEVDEVKYLSIPILKKELDENPQLYVPHHEAYGKLFGVLKEI